MQESRTPTSLWIIRILATIAAAVPLTVGIACLLYVSLVLHGGGGPTTYPRFPAGSVESALGLISTAWSIPLILVCLGVWFSHRWAVTSLGILCGIQAFVQFHSFNWFSDDVTGNLFAVHTLFVAIVAGVASWAATRMTGNPPEQRGFSVIQSPVGSTNRADASQESRR